MAYKEPPGGAGGAVSFSAGTSSAALGSIVFSNSGGVSFGLNGSTITASVGAAGGGLTNINLSAGTTSNNLSAVTFSNLNGVSFGLNGSVITGSVVTTYLTTAALSNHSHGNPTLNLTNLSGTTASNSAGLTLSLSAAAPGISNINVSAGTTSNNLSALTFNNSNGVSFGLNGSVITATVATNYQAQGAYLTTAMLSNAATISNINVSAGTTSNNLSALTFNNSNGVSFGLSGSVVTATVATNYQAAGAYLTTARASNDAVGLNTAQTNVTWTVNSSGLSINASGYVGTPFATTTVAGSVVAATHNSAGVTLAVPAYLTTAQAPGAYLTTARASNDGIGTNTAQTNVTWTANSAGLSFNAAGYAGTGTSATNASITMNSNGLAISVAAPGGGAGNTLSYYANMPVVQNTQTMTMLQSTSGMFPFSVPQNLSFAFIRLLGSGSVLAVSSTAATTGATSYTAGAYRSHNMVIYSRGAGANLNSLQYVTSTQNAEQYLATLSCAANSTQFSYSNRYTLFASNGQTNFTKDYSSSAASLNFHTSNLTNLTGLKVLDFPFAGSLSPGQYWLGYGISSTTSTGRTADQSRLGIAFTYIGASQATLPFGVLGAATNSSVMMMPAHGSFSTAGAAGTTSSVGMAVVSSSASQNMLYFQLMRVT